MESIRIRGLLIKSEQQIESVRNSPEFLRCTQEEQLGRPFADVCEVVRHQAASVDEVRTELVIPAYFRTFKEIELIVPNIVNVLKTLVIGNLVETPSNHISADEMKIISKVSRTGDEAQLIIDYNGRRYEVRNIRFPALLKGILPISLRTPFRFVGLNRLNRNASPACHVGPTHVSTFDSKMVNYELNNCFHLLFKDCSGKIPVAVMARNHHGASKEVKILAGIAEVLMTPISVNNMKIQLNMNGQQQIIRVQPGEVKVIRHNGLEILEIKMTQDNAYEIYAVQEGLFMIFDGKHAQIFGNYLLRSRSQQVVSKDLSMFSIKDHEKTLLNCIDFIGIILCHLNFQNFQTIMTDDFHFTRLDFDDLLLTIHVQMNLHVIGRNGSHENL